MKRTASLLIAMVVVLGLMAPGVAVGSSGQHSTYRIVCDLPEEITACEAVVIPVTGETDVLGDLGYDGVQLHIRADPRAGDVTVTLFGLSYTNEFYSFAFDLPANWSQTFEPLVHFSKPGEYTVTFSLVDAQTKEVIDGITQSVTTTVLEAEDIPRYNLTISSTVGGSVTAPGEGTFVYNEGAVVELAAEAEQGYRFVNWAGDVATIGSVFAAQTTISMDADYEITVRFAAVLASRTETATNGTVNARAEASAEVIVSGAATVRVDKYAEDPLRYTTEDAPFWPPFAGAPGSPDGSVSVSLGKYIDVYVPDTQDVTEIEIRLYYTADEVAAADIKEETLRLYSGRPTETDVSHLDTVTVLAWAECSYSGVNITGGYIWAKIRADTTPSLADLEGTPFGGYGSSPGVPQPPCAIATAAYGTDKAQEIQILREFRDTVLLPSRLGAAFVTLYYRTSPLVADLISRHNILRATMRVGVIDRIVAVLNWSQAWWSVMGR